MKKTWFVLVVVLAAIACCDFCCGCINTPPPAPPPSGGGFTVTTLQQCSYGSTTYCPLPGVTLYGWWTNDLPSANGSVYSFGPVETCTGWLCEENGALVYTGQYYQAGARWPAEWGFNASCGDTAGFAFVQGPSVNIECTGNQIRVYSINPDAINPNDPPATTTVSGPGGFTTTYGMPMVQYYDPTGTLQGSAYATSVSSDGTSMTGPTPSINSSAPSGSYVGIVLNADANYNYDIVGAAVVYVSTTCP